MFIHPGKELLVRGEWWRLVSAMTFDGGTGMALLRRTARCACGRDHTTETVISVHKYDYSDEVEETR